MKGTTSIFKIISFQFCIAIIGPWNILIQLWFECEGVCADNKAIACAILKISINAHPNAWRIDRDLVQFITLSVSCQMTGSSGLRGADSAVITVYIKLSCKLVYSLKYIDLLLGINKMRQVSHLDLF